MTIPVALAKDSTKIVVSPVEHYSGARRTRTTWAAEVVPTSGGRDGIPCGHVGHRTTEAAIQCAMRIWHRLPSRGNR